MTLSVILAVEVMLCVTGSRIEMVINYLRAIHGKTTPESTHTMQLCVADPLDTLIYVSVPTFGRSRTPQISQ